MINDIASRMPGAMPARLGALPELNLKGVQELKEAGAVTGSVKQRLDETETRDAVLPELKPELRLPTTPPAKLAEVDFVKDAGASMSALRGAHAESGEYGYIGSSDTARMMRSFIALINDERQSDRTMQQMNLALGAKAVQAQAAKMIEAGNEALATAIGGATASMALSVAGATKSVKAINTQIKSVDTNLTASLSQRRAATASHDSIHGRHRANDARDVLDRQTASSARAGERTDATQRRDGEPANLPEHYAVELGRVGNEQLDSAARLDAAHTTVQHRADTERVKAMVVNQAADAVNNASMGVREQLTAVSNAEALVQGSYAQAANSAADGSRGEVSADAELIATMLASMQRMEESKQQVWAQTSQSLGA